MKSMFLLLIKIKNLKMSKQIKMKCKTLQPVQAKESESNFQWLFHSSAKSKQIFQVNVFLFVHHIYLLLELLQLSYRYLSIVYAFLCACVTVKTKDFHL